MTRLAQRTRLSERLTPKLALLWAGLSIGVAFVATPAKFLAPTLSLSVALDVGRHTFRVYNAVELGLLVALAALALGSADRRHGLFRIVVPAAIVIVQALWLLPVLDQRADVIRAGGGPLPASNLHSIYIAAESLKVLWLLALGLGGMRSHAGGYASRARRTSWISFPQTDHPPGPVP